MSDPARCDDTVSQDTDETQHDASSLSFYDANSGQDNVDGERDGNLHSEQLSELTTDVNSSYASICSDFSPSERPGCAKLRTWLNHYMRIQMTDGRVLIGLFMCTDKDKNVILGSCQEYLSMEAVERQEEARPLGLAMIPGQHITTLEVDMPDCDVM